MRINRLLVLLFTYVGYVLSFNNINCISSVTCGQDEFCLTTNSSTLGMCMPCWACCEFANTFGQCPWQRCLTCSLPLPVLSFYDRYAATVVGDNIENWLVRQLVRPSTKDYLLSTQFKISNNISNLISNTKTICPSGEMKGKSTLPGCPCIDPTSPNIAGPMCPPGFICSDATYNGLSYMMYADGITAHILRGRCLPCQTGQYCAGGRMQVCPSGFYCPDPSQMYDCPNGSFCPEGSIAAYPCDITGYVQSIGKLGLTIPRDPNTILERLFLGLEPLYGNYCPARASDSATKCPAGYYCTSPDKLVICPAGYFCRSQSSAPTKCGPVSVCPEGSGEPKVNLAAYIFCICIAIGMAMVACSPFFFQKRGLYLQRQTQIYNNNNGPVDLQSYNAFDDPYEHLRQRITSSDHLHDCVSIPTPEFAISNCLTYISVQGICTPWLKPSFAQFKPRGLNAIIGGSGCGKSTFLDVMRGKVPHHSCTGKVHIKTTNQSLELDLSNINLNTFHTMKGIRGFVPQDDVVYGDLTVEENIRFSAQIKGVQNVNTAVASVLDKLGLTAIKDSQVGTVDKRGISGGQRKRVNIGMEIVTMPSLLLMDEPTSGLDAHGTQQLTEYLRLLADSGMTIIAAIHQPRYTSFELFDNLLLLSKFGTVFEGAPISAIIYFAKALGYTIDKNENPADVIMDIISVDSAALAPVWASRGLKWVTDLCATYPMHQDFLRHDCVCDQVTARTLNLLIANAENDVGVVFTMLNLPSDARHAMLEIDQFKKMFNEVCSSAFLSNKYSSVIERISLLCSLPRPINYCHHMKAYIIAKRFINLLLTRINKDPIHIEYSPTQSNNDANPSMLLLSMMCKSIDKNLFKHRSNRVDDTNALSHGNFIMKCYRKLLLIWRSPWAIQIFIALGAALIIGNLQSYDLIKYPNTIAGAYVCLGVISVITHVRTFSLDKVIINREIENKIGFTQFFAAYNVVDLCTWVALIPLMFTYPYYVLLSPNTPYVIFYGTGVMVCWWSSGLGYLVSALPLALYWCNLIAVFISLILGAFLQGLEPTLNKARASSSGILSFLTHVSYNRWAMEILTAYEFKQYDPTQINVVWSLMSKVGLCGYDLTDIDVNEIDVRKPGFSYRKVLGIIDKFSNGVTNECDSYIRNAFLWLFMYGALFRIAAFIIFYAYANPVLYTVLMQKLRLHLRKSNT